MHAKNIQSPMFSDGQIHIAKWVRNALACGEVWNDTPDRVKARFRISALPELQARFPQKPFPGQARSFFDLSTSHRMLRKGQLRRH